jgi:hypothetical protein
MWFIKRVGIVAAALSLAGPAAAADMCFQAGPTWIFVAKSYRKPAKGKCQELTGYEGSTATAFPAEGTACLNAAGTTLSVRWQAFLYDWRDFNSLTTLPYPSLTGGYTQYVANSPLGDIWGSINPNSAYPCDPLPIP